MKIVTFGELMLRLAPEGYLRFVQSDKLEATFGGAEANVAVSLANYGMDAAFVSKLPEHEIGLAHGAVARHANREIRRVDRQCQDKRPRVVSAA